MKMIGELILEVTRDCNLSCAHCLRGQKQSIKMTKEIVDKTLENYDYITSIVFTGGEPSLAADVILYTIKRMKEKKIQLGRFYIVTNAVGELNYDFLKAILELYIYSDEKDCCGLAVSKDKYHSNLNNDLYEIYSAFKFYGTEKEHKENEKGYSLLKMGNAATNNLAARTQDVITSVPYDIYDGMLSYGEMVYINANGDVMFDCDMSYELQEHFSVGNVLDSSLSDIIMSVDEVCA